MTAGLFPDLRFPDHGASIEEVAAFMVRTLARIENLGRAINADVSTCQQLYAQICLRTYAMKAISDLRFGGKSAAETAMPAGGMVNGPAS